MEPFGDEKLHSCAQLMERIEQVGFLPLLPCGVAGWSAEEMMDDECQYSPRPDGGWEWLLWEWKGDILRESGCAYGKFIGRKATFISSAWWPDFCNHRRHVFPRPEVGSVEETILCVLRRAGSMTTRELRAACGFTGPGMRGRFDAYVTRLQESARIVTEDFVYPRDSHGHRYGWGWSLLTTPEALFGPSACRPDRTPQESLLRLQAHFRRILPALTDKRRSALLK